MERRTAPPEGAGAGRTRTILAFRVDGARYGISLGDASEILRAVAIQPLPGAPTGVEGVVNVRGRAVPVFDLRGRFGHPDKAVEPSDHFVVARSDDQPVILRVDRVADLMEVSPQELDDASPLIPGAGYVSHVAPDDDGVVLISDLSTFLSQEERISLDRALAELKREDAPPAGEPG